MSNAGMSTCPCCGRIWLVTPEDDCLMPSCGCFGHDTSANNPKRLCEACGMKHVNSCAKIPKPNPLSAWLAATGFAFINRHERIRKLVYAWLKKRGITIISRQQ